MTYFVLDLDGTTIDIHGNHPPLINSQYHELWGHIDSELGDVKLAIGIINPGLLLQVLNAASKCEGLIILTAGSWSPNILKAIIDTYQNSGEYSISEEVRKMFASALFFSPEIESIRDIFSLYNHTVEQIRYMNKAERLKKIIEFESLDNEYFVVLDDNPDHIKSFEHMPNVTAIRATTKSNQTDFYYQVIKALNKNVYLKSKETLLVKRPRPINEIEIQKGCKIPCLPSRDLNKDDTAMESIDFPIINLISDDSEEDIADTSNSVDDCFAYIEEVNNYIENLSLLQWSSRWQFNHQYLAALKLVAFELITNGNTQQKVERFFKKLPTATPFQLMVTHHIINTTDFPDKIQFISELNAKFSNTRDLHHCIIKPSSNLTQPSYNDKNLFFNSISKDDKPVDNFYDDLNPFANF